MPPPYFFADFQGHEAGQTAASYLVQGRSYRFPAGHRLAGDQTITTMEVMQRNMLRLFVRFDYDFEAFKAFLNHDIQDLLLPYDSAHVNLVNGWSRDLAGRHHGLDFNDAPRPRSPFPDHPSRTTFNFLSAADGTVVGWDEVKLLTLEHVASNGKLYRTLYNMMDLALPVPTSPALVELGGAVAAGELLGRAMVQTRIHLHFAMAVPHTVPVGWTQDTKRLFDELCTQFGLTFQDQAERDSIVAKLDDPIWPRTEWFIVDPFGLYGMDADYGPEGFYYPVPPGVGTYAFRDGAIAGDSGGDRIPNFAASERLRANLSVQPLSLGTLFAVGG